MRTVMRREIARALLLGAVCFLILLGAAVLAEAIVPAVQGVF